MTSLHSWTVDEKSKNQCVFFNILYRHFSCHAPATVSWFCGHCTALIQMSSSTHKTRVGLTEKKDHKQKESWIKGTLIWRTHTDVERAWCLNIHWFYLCFLVSSARRLFVCLSQEKNTCVTDCVSSQWLSFSSRKTGWINQVYERSSLFN